MGREGGRRGQAGIGQRQTPRESSSAHSGGAVCAPERCPLLYLLLCQAIAPACEANDDADHHELGRGRQEHLLVMHLQRVAALERQVRPRFDLPLNDARTGLYTLAVNPVCDRRRGELDAVLGGEPLDLFSSSSRQMDTKPGMSCRNPLCLPGTPSSSPLFGAAITSDFVGRCLFAAVRTVRTVGRSAGTICAYFWYSVSLGLGSF
eukprot:7382578-Prymnesium_polylepis.1